MHSQFGLVVMYVVPVFVPFPAIHNVLRIQYKYEYYSSGINPVEFRGHTSLIISSASNHPATLSSGLYPLSTSLLSHIVSVCASLQTTSFLRLFCKYQLIQYFLNISHSVLISASSFFLFVSQSLSQPFVFFHSSAIPAFFLLTLQLSDDSLFFQDLK